MTKPKILITIRGGVVQHVAATQPVDIYIQDWDAIMEAESFEQNDFNQAREADEVLTEEQFSYEVERAYNEANDEIKKFVDYEDL